MMQASGIVYLAKTKPLATLTADGIFTLTLLVYDRQDTHRVEPWRIWWSGLDAQAFWQDHAGQLTPGQPLHVNLRRIRSFVLGDHHGCPESHAEVVLAHLAPAANRPVPKSAADCLLGY